MTNYKQVYINGQWVTPSSSETIEVWDSTDESVMATIPSCGAADVELAAKAARAAFDSWAALT
ncbi:MAG: aldehyde dehydrogenase family protein, partial [Actinobacteria bacterium]|nr:aldehyde dehydrogenase family protein [Actinomycetota bacterium]